MGEKRRQLTTGEAARHIGISQTYVGYLIKKGKLTGERTPLGFLVDIDSADQFKREREAKQAAKREEHGESADDADQRMAVVA